MKKINTIIFAFLLSGIKAQNYKSSSFSSEPTIVGEEPGLYKDSMEMDRMSFAAEIPPFSIISIGKMCLPDYDAMSAIKDLSVADERKLGDIIPGHAKPLPVPKIEEEFLRYYTAEEINISGMNREERLKQVDEIVNEKWEAANKELLDHPNSEEAKRAKIFEDFYIIYTQYTNNTDEMVPELIAKLQALDALKALEPMPTPSEEISDSIWSAELTPLEKLGSGLLYGFVKTLELVPSALIGLGSGIDHIANHFNATDDVVQEDKEQSEYESSDSGSESGDEEESNSWFKWPTFQMPTIWGSQTKFGMQNLLRWSSESSEEESDDEKPASAPKIEISVPEPAVEKKPYVLPPGARIFAITIMPPVRAFK